MKRLHQLIKIIEVSFISFLFKYLQNHCSLKPAKIKGLGARMRTLLLGLIFNIALYRRFICIN